MIKFLTKIKSTIIWYIMIIIIIKPFFKIIWLNIINFKSRQIFLRYCKINNFKKDKIFKNNDKFIIRGDENIKRYATEIHKLLSKEFLRKMTDKIDENKKYTAEHYLFDKPKFQIDLYPYVDDQIKKIILKIVLDEKIIKMASQYLDVMPVLGKIGLNLNVPKHGSEERGSMLWHKDDFGYKTVDFFIPIDEVNKHNGPLYYVKKFNKLGVFHKYTNIIKKPKKGERNKINIYDFKSNVSDDNIDIFTGDKGDFLMIDSFSVYHRGGFCEKNNRLMLRISFHTPDSIDMIDKINLNNKFRYLLAIDENDNNLNFFEKHILFYRPKILYKLKIPQFLIHVYKLLHFKD